MDGILTLVLFLGICFGMHFFMHRGRGHGGGHQHGGHAPESKRRTPPGEKAGEPRKHAGRGCH
jgi:hypothetical protein